MQSTEPLTTIDRSLFAPRPRSWAESAVTFVRNLSNRVPTRRHRRLYEARLLALVATHATSSPEHVARQTAPATATFEATSRVSVS